ncbi:DUF1877 family protein [Corallococcus terminator]|uniref:DUF1877 family protein n=1 Tax=Corallococcus terminator TaxID=2316733 RepID=A0A3A8JDS8_9BACT|nr:DUF1877 family protein [Corallococcus terminator]RKG93859.1 DUF1877 family protein [Corallococcus terminator]
MGFETYYQAIPASSELLDVARQDLEAGEYFWSVLFMFRAPRIEHLLSGGPPIPGQVKLWHLVVEHLRTRPDLGGLNTTLDRHWDRLHFVLSAERRDESGTDEDPLIKLAIRGEDEIAEHVRGGQGVPLRYTRPETVGRIAHMLDGVRFESLRRHFTAVAMDEGSVYKHPHPAQLDDDWHALQEYFERFRVFYGSAAKHADGVLVHRD